MLKPKNDLTGKTFGRWFVIEQAEDHISSSGRHEIKWLCECTCGSNKRKEVLHRSLVYGLSKSCGCISKEVTHNLFFKDLTGQKFGRLTVLERADDAVTNNNNKFIRWKCKCDCGNEIIILSSALTRNEKPTLSCGCLQKEKCSEIIENKYEFTNDGYVIGYTSNTNTKFIFDKEDYELVKQYHWYEESDGYIRASNKNRVNINRLVMGEPNDMPVDHINHDLKDNRKCNLRVCTTSQNQMNTGIRSNNTSGATGVVWVKNENKWKAEIRKDNKVYYLGMFENFDDALKIRKEAEEKYFGEYSYDNSMKVGDVYA